MTRSKPHSDTVIIQTNSRITASRLRRFRSPSSDSGTGSRKSAATNAKLVPARTSARTSVRAQKNGVLSQGAFTAIGVRTQA